jgi:chemotaxis protein MotB
VKTVMRFVPILIILVLLIGCTDSTEQRLRQMQNNLERMFRAKLLDGDIKIQRARDHLTVVITERLLFNVGSDEIKPDGIEVLRQMGALLKAAPLKEIRVAGHGDTASGSDHSNTYFEKLALSKARATHAIAVLRESGMDSQSFIIEWYGNIRPIASNGTEAGRQVNRRVEILLYMETGHS